MYTLQISAIQIGSQTASLATKNNLIENDIKISSNIIRPSKSQPNSPKNTSISLWQRLVKSQIFDSRTVIEESDKCEGNDPFENRVNSNEDKVIKNAMKSGNSKLSNDHNNNSQHNAECLVAGVAEVVVFAETLTTSQVDCLFKAGSIKFEHHLFEFLCVNL